LQHENRQRITTRSWVPTTKRRICRIISIRKTGRRKIIREKNLQGGRNKKNVGGQKTRNQEHRKIGWKQIVLKAPTILRWKWAGGGVYGKEGQNKT